MKSTPISTCLQVIFQKNSASTVFDSKLFKLDFYFIYVVPTKSELALNCSKSESALEWMVLVFPFLSDFLDSSFRCLLPLIHAHMLPQTFVIESQKSLDSQRLLPSFSSVFSLIFPLFASSLDHHLVVQVFVVSCRTCCRSQVLSLRGGFVFCPISMS